MTGAKTIPQNDVLVFSANPYAVRLFDARQSLAAIDVQIARVEKSLALDEKLVIRNPRAQAAARKALSDRAKLEALRIRRRKAESTVVILAAAKAIY